MRDVLSQIAGIHRTYSNLVASRDRFYRLREAQFMRCMQPKGVFLRFEIAADRFSRECPLDEITSHCDAFRPYVHAMLTRDGYRYYVGRCDGCRPLPQLAAMYAAFFYFGSVTRYHPYDFDKIRAGRYGWLIDDFLRTQPLQFVYLCASHMVKRDLYLPFCAVG